ncbi:PAS domain S-box protein [Flavobacterium psychrotrophum]|uniref:PAS domain S-box protein n=1 Tax=Flavobacterium psychrotrophum TaxID=2294119 RepID=UPI000E30F12D|nr:PAS domain-containing protein [Flavobacterium psychrotrophum]
MENFTFKKENFNKIFPFYVLLNNNLEIISYGTSFGKLYPSLKKGDSFNENFRIKRPFLDTITAKALSENVNQLVIIECRTGHDTVIRGQFELLDDKFLFVGSPWFISIEEIKSKSLNIFDFANYDPLLDLLQLLKTQEISTLELRNLLKINNDQREELKKEREELNMQSLVASANNNAIIFTTPDAKIFWCNDAYLKLTGFSREEIFGQTPVEIGNNPAIEKEALQKMIDLFYSGKPFDVEITHGRKDGSYFWTRTQGQPVYNDKGEIQQYFAMIEDMTEIKEKEEQLKLLSLIAEKNMNSVVICDRDGRIEWVNESFEQVTGYNIFELVGKKPGEMLQGKDTSPEAVAYLSRQIREGEPFNCEIVNYNKNGKKFWLQITGQALYNQWGEISRFFAIQEDITERKKLEKQREELMNSLEKSNKELEDYAQIVSHDLKSPLRSINSLMAWIREENEGTMTEQTSLYFSMIENKLEKMDSLIQGVLTYSRIDRADVNREKVNLDEIVNNIIHIIDIPSHIKVTVDCTLPVILADRYRMQQLFQNLIGNAVTYIDKPEGTVNIGHNETKAAHTFYVKDNGPGIAKENHEKIFKIFQSLVKNERSTGLGLSIVKKIIDNYKGKIWLESEPGHGTTFFIQLPKTK